MFDFIEQSEIMEVISQHRNDDANDIVMNVLYYLFDEYKYAIADEIADMTGHHKALHKVCDIFVCLMAETITDLIALVKSSISPKVLSAR
jgi:hypothetical protein